MINFSSSCKRIIGIGLLSFCLILALPNNLLVTSTEISDVPKIVGAIEKLNHPESTNATIFCSIGSGDLNALSYEWRKDDIVINPNSFPRKIRITTLPENNPSILSVIDLKPSDAGVYSCLAKNRFGQDRMSTRLNVKVQLKWISEPKDVEVSVGRPVQIPCIADGLPKPTIEWSRISDSESAKILGSELKFGSINQEDAGQYECRARNGVEKDLTTRIKLDVLVVPARFAEKFTVVQAKSGESAKLECNATGDQPLTVNWFKEDNKLSKRGGDNFEIYETAVSTGVNSVLVIRTVGRADGLTYKCVGENEYGNDERLIKLMVVEVPSRPMNVRVKDSWSRSASIVWSTPFAGNSPITSYIIQYWRKNNNEAGQTAQNHRRQEFTVSGTQTSALITNLSPALTYEASVIAENQVGRSEPSENIAINTGEDEPASAPSDVSVEARGPTTIKVVWKAPPSETWNGKLLGFYIGFRPRSSNSIDSHQNMQMTGSSQVAFSYRTVDYVKGQQVFEAFLTNLIRGHEYEVIVKAFNSVGSGPDSHLMTVRTFDGDLPASPSLFAHQVTQSSISLRWTYPSRAQSSANSIKRYILYYQRQGDDSWLEIGIPVEEKLRSTGHREDGGASNQPGLSISESGTTSYQLTGLDSGFAYKIYVVAVNNFGMGDPSNIVTTKTDGQINGATDGLRYSASSHSGDFNVFEMNRQFQLFLVVPIVCTIIMVVVIVSAVLYCSRRMQSQPAQHIVTSQPQTMHPGGTWGPEGTMQVGQRYVEFDKGGILKTANGSLLGGTQSSDHTHNSSGHPNNIGPGGHYPLPYGTMPMNSVVISDQKSWDRQSTNAPLKPLVTHIYDSPI